LPTHDNIIEYKFLKEYTNYVIMGLEYARAGTLLNLQRGYIHNRKHIKDEDCSKIIKGILLGLKHLSRHDIVHRDLKPSNIVLTDADQLDKVKLVDFGLAVKY
jgi:mitogen-activated protein kinase kinase